MSSIFIGFREFVKYTDFFPNIWEVSSHKLPIFFSAPPCYSSGIQITPMIDLNHRLYHRSQNDHKLKNTLFWSSRCGSVVTSLTSIHEDVVSIPGPGFMLELWCRSQIWLASGVTVAMA